MKTYCCRDNKRRIRSIVTTFFFFFDCISWQRSLEVEDFSKKLAYRGEKLIAQREWEKSINGPGWQDNPDFLIIRNITFSKAQRFSSSRIRVPVIPGPGIY